MPTVTKCRCEEATRNRQLLQDRNPYRDPPPDLPMTQRSVDGEVSCRYCWTVL